jgi:hypothetical protein
MIHTRGMAMGSVATGICGTGGFNSDQFVGSASGACINMGIDPQYSPNAATAGGGVGVGGDPFGGIAVSMPVTAVVEPPKPPTGNSGAFGIQQQQQPGSWDAFGNM